MKASFSDIIKGETPVLVDFFADWCGPCKTLAPILKDVKGDLGDAIKVVKIDVEGLERKILLAIAKCLPKTADLSIVFEIWNEQFSISEIQEAFSNRDVKVKKIVSSSDRTSKFKNLFKTVVFGRREFICDHIANENITGDIILNIK